MSLFKRQPDSRFIIIPREAIITHPLYQWEFGANLPLSRRWKRPVFLGPAVAMILSLIILTLRWTRPVFYASGVFYAGIWAPCFFFFWMQLRAGARIVQARQCGLFQEMCMAGYDPAATLAAFSAGVRGGHSGLYPFLATILTAFFLIPRFGLLCLAAVVGLGIFICALYAIIFRRKFLLYQERMNIRSVAWIQFAHLPLAFAFPFIPIVLTVLLFHLFYFKSIRINWFWGPAYQLAIFAYIMMLQYTGQMKCTDVREVLRRWYCKEPLE